MMEGIRAEANIGNHYLGCSSNGSATMNCGGLSGQAKADAEELPSGYLSKQSRPIYFDTNGSDFSNVIFIADCDAGISASMINQRVVYYDSIVNVTCPS